MKRLWMLAILMTVLAGCGRSAAPAGGQCNQGLCVKIEVAEPIRWVEPIVVTVTMMAERDVSNLQVSLTSYPPVSIEDQGKWIEEGTRANVNLTANRPSVIVRKVRFPSEGTFELMAGVYTPNLPYVSDSVRICLTREGGKVYYANTPEPTSPWTGLGGGPPGGRVRTSEGVECSLGPCLTIRVVEPVRWGEPVRVLLQVEGKKRESVISFPSGGTITVPADFPQLGLTFSSPDPSVQIKPEKGEFKEQMLWPAGNGVWWVADVWADSAQEYTFLVTFPPKEGAYQLHAEGFDPRFGQMVSSDWVHIELSREGGKVFAPSLGTPFPTATPWPTPLPTPTFPPMYTPAPTQPPYPPISPISPIATSTPAAYP